MHYGRRIWRLTFPFHALPPQEAPSFPFLPPSASSSSSPFGDILTWDASVQDPVTSNLQLRRTLGLRAQSLYSAKYGRTTRDLLIRSKPQVAPHSSKRYRWFCREVYLLSFLALIASFHLPSTSLPLSFHFESSLLPSKSKKNTKSSNLIYRVAAPAALATYSRRPLGLFGPLVLLNSN